jgi:hypothetical protein
MNPGDRIGGPRVHAAGLVTAAVTLVLLLCFVSSAHASDASLRASVQAWSRAVAIDAHSVSTNASLRHPRLMTASAVRFAKDASRAHARVARQSPSTAKGRQAKLLALRAFRSYAAAGRLWAASGHARVRGQRALATTLARRAALYARSGNRLLLAAGKALR